MLRINPSWEKVLVGEFEKPYFLEIKKFLSREIEAGKTLYPHPRDIFYAFDVTPFEDVRVVILGQDPYHGPNQAMGMSFSVREREGVRNPPSLKNIYKEIKDEYPEFQIPKNGNLEHWAKQGVFLLNAILTVEGGKPASHSKIGWEKFTDCVIQKISQEKEEVVFLLWGNFARSKKVLIDEKKHFILESPHPSPFSAYSGFFGNGHFKKTNEYLQEKGKKEIDWRI